MPTLDAKPSYPVRRPQDWAAIGRLSLGERLRAMVRDRRYRSHVSSRPGVTLHLTHAADRPVSGDDVILICVVRNGRTYIPSFLAHYRRLGVDRFAFVDDGSDDGSRDLLREPDVDLFTSNVDFRGAGGGLLWRDMLVGHYGRNRWYLSVDSDEYLVFPDSETRSLRAFIDDLQRNGLKRALAVMIDIYPDGHLSKAPPHRPSDAPPTTICPLYDTASYEIENGASCVSVRGGPRGRLFGARMRLNKFPVLFADRWTQFHGANHHAPFPIWRNFSPVHAVLLHYKFPADAVGEFRRIAERGMHAMDARHYKAILAHRNFSESLDMRDAHSSAFMGSRKLVEQGFMLDLQPPTTPRR